MPNLPPYDVFISHASEDSLWCEGLAAKLRDLGLHVGSAKGEIKPDDHLLKELSRSRKMLAVWSNNYFRDDKTRIMLEFFFKQHSDPLSNEPPLIPILLDDCVIPPALKNIPYVDFRTPADFELNLYSLIEALDLPTNEFLSDSAPKPSELDTYRQGRLAQLSGKRFEEEVAILYQLLGFEVIINTQLSGIQIDLIVKQKIGGFPIEAIVECKNTRITAKERDQILAQQNLAQKKLPSYKWIAVSSEGFAANTRIALEGAGVTCITYAELQNQLVPLEGYINEFILDYESWVSENWNGEDWFIRPNLITDITYEKFPALDYFANWLSDPTANFLAILGDLGTGKSTLTRFLAYRLAKSYRDNPLLHPAPVLIPLKEVRKEVSLEGIIISHFSRRGFQNLSYPRFEHLVRVGKITLIFDAFDEMAERWEVTRSNFQELSRAAEHRGKILLTCRTHYFKDRSEQADVLSGGIRLSESETELYKKLRQQYGAQVVYLQEFDREQIQSYINKARPKDADSDWKKIESIYNLKELAQRPLLLDMIVKSLTEFEVGQNINAATLYTVYTNIWMTREERKGRLLDKNIKSTLIKELAWRMWCADQYVVNHRDLLLSIKNLIPDKLTKIDENMDDIARELQTATFLSRNEEGAFSFVHRSFMEYFAARKLYDAFSNDREVITNVLDVRRFERKVIYFLTLLDEKDIIQEPLRKVLSKRYMHRISENALQILYWSGRFQCEMEESINDLERLRQVLSVRLPNNAQLTRAKLENITLEAAEFIEADFSDANLTNANLNNVNLRRGEFRSAKLLNTSMENCLVQGVDFTDTTLEGISLVNSRLEACDFTDADFQESIFFGAIVNNCKGLVATKKNVQKNLQPILKIPYKPPIITISSGKNNLIASGDADGLIVLYQASERKYLQLRNHFYSVYSVDISPYSDQLASGNADSTVRLWDTKAGCLLQTLRGHEKGVNSVQFSFDGQSLVSGSNDKTVRLWNVQSGKQLRVFQGHNLSVSTVIFLSNGELIASGSHDKTIRLWNVNSGKCITTLKDHQSGINSICHSQEGNILASGSSDGDIMLWESDSGKLLHKLQGHIGMITSLDVSPSGKTIASASDDKTVRLWDLSTGECIKVLSELSSEILAVQFAKNGKFLSLACAAGYLQFWDIKKYEPFLDRYTIKPGVWVDLLPDGHFSASPEGIHFLSYISSEDLKAVSAKNLQQRLFNVAAVQKVIERYTN